jgi:hypothetical protein
LQNRGGGSKAKSYDQETGVHIKTSLRLRKNQEENKQRKSPRIKEIGTTLTLGQFVGARMGGVLPQYLVSQIY